MIKKYTIWHKGYKVEVVEAKSDHNHQAQISVLGIKDFKKDYFKNFKDQPLLDDGWKELAKVNAGLFFSEGNYNFTNGIVKSKYEVIENDDFKWDNVMGLYHEQGVPYIVNQAYMRQRINQANIRGMVVGAFGLINNGAFDNKGGRAGDPNRSLYLARSGRTIVGKKADGTIVFASFKGVTGKTGLTGYETYLLAKNVLGLRNAICMDGGGSVFMSHSGKTVIDSSRQGTTALAIYYK